MGTNSGGPLIEIMQTENSQRETFGNINANGPQNVLGGSCGPEEEALNLVEKNSYGGLGWIRIQV